MADSPAIVAEHTPNPDAIRFLLGRPLVDAPCDFDAPPAPAVAPLPAALFGCGGVARVFLGPDFVVVTKEPDADWARLADPVQQVLREFLASGRDPVDARGVCAPATPDAGESATLERLLREQISPLVAAHGGHVELLEYRAGVARLSLRGACAGCPASELTLRSLIERRLRAALPELVAVEAEP